MSKSNEQQVQAPEGFRRLGSVANAGWALAAAGAVIHGTLEGVYERPDELRKEQGGTSKFFQLRLLKPCMVRMGKGESAEAVEAQVGDYVNVNYGPKSKLLEPLCGQVVAGAIIEVFMTCYGKIKLDTKRNMWNWDVLTKTTKAPSPTETDLDGGDAGEDASF